MDEHLKIYLMFQKNILQQLSQIHRKYITKNNFDVACMVQKLF